MTTPLIPPDTSDLDVTLARNWAIQVNTGTIASPVWTWIRGVNSFDAPISDTLQEAGDYDSGQWGAQVSTEKAWVATIGVGRKLDATAAPDPGVEYLRAKGLQVGGLGMAQIRWWRTDGLPDAYQGRGTVNFTSAGGEKTALQGGTITITGYGRLTAIAKPSAVAASEVQIVALLGGPTGGTFTLALDGQVSAPIANNAAASAVQTALQALSTVGSGNALVTGAAGGPYTITFAGALAAKDVTKLVANGAALTGGTNPSVQVATLVNGSPGQ